MGYNNCMNRNANIYKKSVLNTYTVAQQSILPNGVLQFNENKPFTGCSIKHAAGSNTVSLPKQGMYLITGDVVFTSTIAGDASFVLAKNGVDIPQTKVTTTVTANGTATLPISTISRVTPCSNYDDEDGTDITVKFLGIEVPGADGAAPTASPDPVTVKIVQLHVIKLA